MPPSSFRRAARLAPRALAAAGMLAVLAGCNTTARDDKFYGLIRPYRVEIVQGNVVTQEMMAQIQPGLGRAQVRDILGSPLLTSAFHGNRWDYVFKIRRQGAEPQERRVTVFFNGEQVERFEADELPSERDFVAAIDTARTAKVPPLELSPEQREKLPRPQAAPAARNDAPVGPARDYPTLEPITP
jgi:outer membrane protein assembly factor BamE